MKKAYLLTSGSTPVAAIIAESYMDAYDAAADAGLEPGFLSEEWPIPLRLHGRPMQVIDYDLVYHDDDEVSA